MRTFLVVYAVKASTVLKPNKALVQHFDIIIDAIVLKTRSFIIKAQFCWTTFPVCGFGANVDSRYENILTRGTSS